MSDPKPLARALMYAAIAYEEDEAVRCVVLTGSGRQFCVSGDICAFQAAGDRLGVLIKEITSYLHMAIARRMRMRKPLVTSINGPAAGAGVSLAVFGDIALASRSAHFTLAYTALGVSPDAGSTWLLPRLIGLRRTQEFMLLNPRIGAGEALSLGLVTRIVDENTLGAETSRLAEKFTGSATAALGRTRWLLLASFGASFEEQMEAETRAIAESANRAESIRAFFETRVPNFTGRESAHG